MPQPSKPIDLTKLDVLIPKADNPILESNTTAPTEVQLPEARTKDIPGPATANTPQVFPKASDSSSPSNSLVLTFATVADEITPWGVDVARRDRELRDFWPTETILEGAVFGIVARNSAFKWRIVPKKGEKVDAAIITEAENLLWTAHYGKGWTHYNARTTLDINTQDNAAFTVIIREHPTEDSKCVGIAHLDAALCVRTGDPRWPVIYTDRNGKPHKLPWWSVCTLEDLPSPIESMNGVQYSAVTRVLRAAQIIRDLAIYKREKISGRFSKAIHLVGGIQRSEIELAKKLAREDASNQGMIRYVEPIILTALDPNADVKHVLLEMASLPEGFDEDTTLRWYIAQLANGFGTDYQEFAPLPAGNLGTSQQSAVLSRRARLKGPALFMSAFWYMINYYRILDPRLRFEYGEDDPQESQEVANLRKSRAEERAARINSKEITTSVARQLAVRDGDLTQEQADEADKAEQEERAKQEKLAAEQAKVVGAAAAASGSQAAVKKPGRPDTFRNTPKPGSPTQDVRKKSWLEGLLGG